ncbi:hypothetical protein MRBLWH7_003407 [Microbacterium sp. LWH7-1.2]|uniref:hypothetical protein n=1 Tax=Microbacterium sp. LWH7-1.2 TaxID=3135257 RepID=UPI003139044B
MMTTVSTPSRSRGMPNVKRAAPLWASKPMRPMTRPRPTLTKPREADAPKQGADGHEGDDDEREVVRRSEQDGDVDHVSGGECKRSGGDRAGRHAALVFGLNR